MKAQGSNDDLKNDMRPPLALDSGDRECSCSCMKTTTKSVQARRGLDGAQWGMADNFHGWRPAERGQKKDRHRGGQGLASLLKLWRQLPWRTA